MPGPYLDGLLTEVVSEDGTPVAKVGGAYGGGFNFQAPLTATPNSATGNVDVTASGGTLPVDVIVLPPVTAPASPGSGWEVYVDSADGRLKAKDSSGNVVILSGPMQTTKTIALTANATTADVNIFVVSGMVQVLQLWACVTVTIGPNHTAQKLYVTDGTVTANLSAAAVTPLSAAPVNSLLVAAGSGTPLNPVSTATATGGIGTLGNSPIGQVGEKHGTTTHIVYQYATTDAPTSGAIQFFVKWEPLSAGATLTAA